MSNQYSLYTGSQGPSQRFNATDSSQAPEESKTTLRHENIYGQPSAVVPSPLAQNFFNTVKKGNLEEIKSFLCTSYKNYLANNKMDPSALVDNFYRHTGLFYASLIKDPIK